VLSFVEIQHMTEEYGEGWGYPHVRRILKLIELIGKDLPHNTEILTWATYLRDWGGLQRFVPAGVLMPCD
jgi:hypothetical protein